MTSLRRFVEFIVVVTGGGRGLGAAIALRFAREGAQIILIDRHEESTRLTAASIAALGGDCLPLIADVSQPDAVQSAFDTIQNRFGGIDVLVNNAGIYTSDSLSILTDTRWNDMIDTNVSGMLYCTRAAVPLLRARGGGSIINMSSIAGLTGFPNSAAYCTTKAAVSGLTRATAVELAPDNIIVNAVAPGSIDTDMLRQVDEAITREEGTEPGSYIMARAAGLPVRRIGTPDDVAGVVTFLASADARFIVGQTLLMDGGQLAI